MKTVLALVTLTLLTFSANAEVGYRPGSVVEQACGQNSMVPMGHGTRYGYVSRVCKVSITGLNVKAPFYTFEVVSNRGERTNYVYAQQSLKPVNTAMNGNLSSRGRQMLVELKIIGTSAKGQFSQIFFIRDPGTVSMIIEIDSYNSLIGLLGNLKVMGDSSNTFPVRINNFNLVYHTM